MSKEKTEEVKYRALLRDVAQIVIGEQVSETDDVVTLKKTAILHVQAKDQSIDLQFVPLELVSLNPPISLKMLCSGGSDLDLEMSFKKSELLVDDVPLSDDIFNHYKEFLNPSRIVSPPSPGALVGPDGEPLDDVAPKVQDLF